MPIDLSSDGKGKGSRPTITCNLKGKQYENTFVVVGETP